MSNTLASRRILSINDAIIKAEEASLHLIGITSCSMALQQIFDIFIQRLEEQGTPPRPFSLISIILSYPRQEPLAKLIAHDIQANEAKITLQSFQRITEAVASSCPSTVSHQGRARCYFHLLQFGGHTELNRSVIIDRIFYPNASIHIMQWINSRSLEEAHGLLNLIVTQSIGYNNDGFNLSPQQHFIEDLLLALPFIEEGHHHDNSVSYNDCPPWMTHSGWIVDFFPALVFLYHQQQECNHMSNNSNSPNSINVSLVSSSPPGDNNTCLPSSLRPTSSCRHSLLHFVTRFVFNSSQPTPILDFAVKLFDLTVSDSLILFETTISMTDSIPTKIGFANVGFNLIHHYLNQHHDSEHTYDSSSSSSLFLDHNHSVRFILQLWTLRLMVSDPQIINKENIFKLFGHQLSVELMINTIIPILLNHKRHMLALRVLVQALEFVNHETSQRTGAWTLIEQLLHFEAALVLSNQTAHPDDPGGTFTKTRRLRKIVADYYCSSKTRWVPNPIFEILTGDDFVYSSAVFIGLVNAEMEDKSQEIFLPSDIVCYHIVPFIRARPTIPKLIQRFQYPSHRDQIRMTHENVPIPLRRHQPPTVAFENVARCFFGLLKSDPPTFFFKHFLGSFGQSLTDGKALMYYSMKSGGDSMMQVLAELVHHPKVSTLYRCEFFQDIYRRFGATLSYQSWQYYLDALFYPGASSDLQDWMYGRTRKVRESGQRSLFDKLEQCLGNSVVSLRHSCIVNGSSPIRQEWMEPFAPIGIHHNDTADGQASPNHRFPLFHHSDYRKLMGGTVQSICMRYSLERHAVWLYITNPPIGRADLGGERKVQFERLFMMKGIDFRQITSLFDLTLDDGKLFVDSVALSEDAFLKIIREIGQKPIQCRDEFDAARSNSSAPSSATLETILDHVLQLFCLGAIASADDYYVKAKRLYQQLEAEFFYQYNFGECSLIAFHSCHLNETITDEGLDKLLRFMIGEIEHVEALTNGSLFVLQQLVQYERSRTTQLQSGPMKSSLLEKIEATNPSLNKCLMSAVVAVN